jgi:anti-sigma B factor antagonist
MRLFAIQDNEEGQQQLLNFDVRIDDSAAGVPVVHVSGELDAFSVGLFRGAMLSLSLEGYRFAVVHLKELAFVDSVGLGGLVSIYTRLKKQGGALYLAAPSEQVSKVLRITGLDALFPVYPTCEAALAAARAAAALENAPG